MKAMVLYVNDRVLVLDEVIRDVEGRVTQAIVQNGAWSFQIRGNHLIVNDEVGTTSYPIFSYELVEVDSAHGLSYDEVIDMAEGLREKYRAAR